MYKYVNKNNNLMRHKFFVLTFFFQKDSIENVYYIKDKFENFKILWTKLKIV